MNLLSLVGFIIYGTLWIISLFGVSWVLQIYGRSTEVALFFLDFLGILLLILFELIGIIGASGMVWAPRMIIIGFSMVVDMRLGLWILMVILSLRIPSVRALVNIVVVSFQIVRIIAVHKLCWGVIEVGFVQHWQIHWREWRDHVLKTVIFFDQLIIALS